MKDNHLLEVPVEGFENLANLKNLDLSDNFIETVPSGISHLYSLEILDLTNNYLQKYAFADEFSEVILCFFFWEYVIF